MTRFWSRIWTALPLIVDLHIRAFSLEVDMIAAMHRKAEATKTSSPGHLLTCPPARRYSPCVSLSVLSLISAIQKAIHVNTRNVLLSAALAPAPS